MERDRFRTRVQLLWPGLGKWNGVPYRNIADAGYAYGFPFRFLYVSYSGHFSVTPSCWPPT